MTPGAPQTPTQRRLFCTCGGPLPGRAARCRACSRRLLNSGRRFGGNRDAVVERDGGCCRGCGVRGAGKSLHVHHRQPGRHDPSLLVTLCAACHARVHRLRSNRRWLPAPLLEWWREQHPASPLQLQLPLEAAR